MLSWTDSDQKIFLYPRHNKINQRFIPYYIGNDIYIFLAEYDIKIYKFKIIREVNNNYLSLSDWNLEVNKYHQFKLIGNNDGWFKIQNVESKLFLTTSDNRNNQKDLILSYGYSNEHFYFNRL